MALFAELVEALLRWINSRLPHPIQQTSRTIGNNISRIVTTLVETFPQLKRFARVPKLVVRNPVAGKPKEYPLLHDRFILGRDRRVSDIIVDNPLVSKEHLSIERKNFLPDKPFVIQDRRSQHGIYQGNKKIDREFVLRDGDVLTLGKPELANSVRIKFLNPPPLHISAALYSGYAIISIPILFFVLSGLAWLICPPVNPLPIRNSQPSIIYASNLTPLYKPRNFVHKEAKDVSEFPVLLPQAVIASEDSRYYWHQGIDTLGIVRAILINLKNRKLSEGGSTLSQQVARILFPSYVGEDRSFFRKFKEAGIALKLETQYSKDVILLSYLNTIYLGEGVYGFQDAAKVYFGKSVNKLEPSEIATLVAMLPGPNGFDLCRNKDNASHKELVDRRNRVIKLLLANHQIKSDDATLALRSTIQAAPSFCQNLKTRNAPYLADYVNQEIKTLLGEEVAKQGNFFIETSLNLEMQKQAEIALEKIINQEGISQGFSQGAVTTIDPNTGRILALVGGVDYQKSQLNRATQAQRQPGSTFKVFAYTTALEQGIRPEKTYSCDKLDWEGEQEPFKPCQHTNKNSLDMYDSIALSENVIALRIAGDVGLDNVVKTATKMGIKSKLRVTIQGKEKAVPRLILGHSEVNLLELTGAYAVLANEGIKTRPHAIKRIFDSSSCKDIQNFNTCRVIYSDNTETESRVLKPEVAKTMTRLLTGVVERKDGTGNKANLPGVQVAGKTGTTNGARDLWFVGYMPNELVTGVWLGNDENTPTSGTSALAAQVWRDYMSRFVR